MKRFAILAAAGALLLAGCETQNVYRGERPAARALTGSKPVRTAKSASLPPAQARARVAGKNAPVAIIANGQVGNYMDGQEAELRRSLRPRGVRVARMGDDIVLVIRSDVLFRLGSVEVSPSAAGTVDAVANILRHYDKTLIEVNGYTDTTGSSEYNTKLSQTRAEAVANILVDDGVNPARISPRGYGEADPRVPTGDGVNEPRNRRVEIRIVPHTAEG